MIEIKQNNYQQPTEVRESVVKDICDAFLRDCCWSVFHPFDDGMRCRTHYVLKRDNKAYGFGKTADQFDDYGIKFHGCEMREAFRVLINAGYFMFKVYTYGSWMGYVCKDEPMCDKGTRVYEFTDRID